MRIKWENSTYNTLQIVPGTSHHSFIHSSNKKAFEKLKGGRDEPGGSLREERYKQSEEPDNSRAAVGAEAAMQDDIGEAEGDAVQGRGEAWKNSVQCFTKTETDSPWKTLSRGTTMTWITYQKDSWLRCWEWTMESGERVEAGRPARSLLQWYRWDDDDGLDLGASSSDAGETRWYPDQGRQWRQSLRLLMDGL